MKKKLMIFISIVCILVLAACGQKNSNENSANEKKSDSKNPKIASLSIHLTNDLLALGVTPAGSVIGGNLKDFLPHVKDRLKNTTKLGVVTDPDMEALLALNPDQIYLDEEFSGKDVSKYKKIATTHVFNLNEGTWRDHLRKIGKLVNREKQAEKFIKDYDAEAKEVKSLIHHKIGNGKVMAIRVTAKELRVFSTRRPMGPILFDDLGLKPAKGIDKIDKTKPFEVISQEELPDFDADAILVVVDNQDGAKKVFEQLKNNAIWKGLKAVKKHQVYTISDQPWLDYSALGNKLALDDAKKIFSK